MNTALCWVGMAVNLLCIDWRPITALRMTVLLFSKSFMVSRASDFYIWGFSLSE